ncbi:MAG TPA: GTP-binding protein [Magnetospirillaceae bacterium]|nr:GTP-binding protein [Magnetospirillaceae bacterium]
MSGAIPVVILTGSLGAGKTTLLNRILSEAHGHRYAVMVNEFGEIGIDHDLIEAGDEELVEMSNGCLCCTVRGDLIRALYGLLGRADAFDTVLIETSGLAEPAPVLQSLLVDPYLRERTEIASVITLADAAHVERRLADSVEAVEQIAFADQILLNKTDLADEQTLTRIEARLRALNPLARLQRSRHGDIPLDRLLSGGGFSLDRIVELEPDLLAGTLHRHDHHHHDHAIDSVSLRAERPLDQARFTAWIEALIAERGADILRAKGILDIAGAESRLVVQAVHHQLEGDFQRPWRPGEIRCSRLVLIGRHLDAAALRRGFAGCSSPSGV